MRRLFATLFGAAVASASVTATAQDRVTEPVELVLGRADAEIKLRAQEFLSIFGDEHYDWGADLETGIITFTSKTKVVSAPLQVVGTYNNLDGTFLWGWDHPSVPEALAADARLAREFGKRNDLTMYTTSKIECTEDEAWALTAVALYLGGGAGAYRGPAGTTLVFMTYGKMTIAAVN